MARTGRTGGPNPAIERVGQRWTPLTDLYYRILEWGWTRVFLFLGSGYISINVAFALLYMAGGESLAGVEHLDFLTAFFFSVQTMSTIGYGSLAPNTTYANVLVSVEAFVGLGSVAMATGLLFAKFSRPRAKVLFSDAVLVTRYNGRDCVLFRVANARGNEIVEASMNVAALLDEETAEGHRLRRLHDVKLRRSMSPLFAYSWLVIHEIDEESPFYGLAFDDIVEESVLLIVSMRGLDGTFAQEVHARRMYQPGEMVRDRKFIDVMERTESGLTMDYRRFHLTEPADHLISGRLGIDEPPGKPKAVSPATTSAEAS